jgi:type II secretory pathway predicted ATPase ExeA
VTGIVGSGKTMLLRRLWVELEREGKVLVCKSLSVDKDRTTMPTLIVALFRRARQPIALFVDEAYDLHAKTLTGLKHLMEMVADGGGTLPIVLVGHPELPNDLCRLTMEEIGYGATGFAFDGLAGIRREYIDWLLRTCAAEAAQPVELIDDAEIDLLAA